MSAQYQINVCQMSAQCLPYVCQMSHMSAQRPKILPNVILGQIFDFFQNVFLYIYFGFYTKLLCPHVPSGLVTPLRRTGYRKEPCLAFLNKVNKTIFDLA